MSGSKSETPDNQHALQQGELQRPIGRRSRRTQGLTPLDHLLIDAAVDSQKAVVGALNERDLNGAVEEFISLIDRSMPRRVRTRKGDRAGIGPAPFRVWQERSRGVG